MPKKIYFFTILILNSFSTVSIEIQQFTPEDESVSADKLADESIKSSHIKNNEITNSKIKEASIAIKKLKGEGLDDLSIPSWSNADSKWIASEFSDLDPNSASVNQIIRGVGLENQGTSITSTGTISLDIGGSALDIAQYDENKDLTNKKNTNINSTGTNSGKINFLSNTIDIRMISDGSQFSFYNEDTGQNLLGIRNSGNVEIKKDLISTSGKVSIDDKYSIPTSAPKENQILGTNSSGDLTWLSLEDISGAESSTNVLGNSKSVKVTSDSAGSFDIEIDSSSTTPVTDGLGESWFTRLKINDDGLAIEYDHITATNIPTGIDATNFSSGLISNQEFNNLEGVDVSTTIESRLDPLEATDFSSFLPITGGSIDGKLQMTSNEDFHISTGSKLLLDATSNITLAANATFTGDDLLDQDDLADDSVTSSEIKDGVITNAHISPAASLSFNKMKTLAPNMAIATNSPGGKVTTEFTSIKLESLGLIDDTNVLYNSLDSIPNDSTLNTSIGINSLKSLKGGDGNTAIGYNSGAIIEEGNSNIILGNTIGAGADSVGKIVIGNSSTNLIIGDTVNDLVTFNSDLDINVSLNTQDVSNQEIEALIGIDTPTSIETRLSDLSTRDILLDTYIDSSFKLSNEPMFSINRDRISSPTCSANYYAVGGGCNCSGSFIEKSRRNLTSERWYCECNIVSNRGAYVICSKLSY